MYFTEEYYKMNGLDKYLAANEHLAAIPAPVRCVFCRQLRCYWTSTGTGWRLMNESTNKIHKCAEYARFKRENGTSHCQGSTTCH